MRFRLVLAPVLGAVLAGFAGFAAPAAYRPAGQTALPNMPSGDFDQLVADLARYRLYVSAEDGAAMDVFDLRTGALLQTGGPVGSPHKAVFDAVGKHVLVADGADGSVKVLDEDLRLVARIPVGAKPDAGVIDPKARIFYVGSHDESGTASIVSAVSLDNFRVLRTFPIAATTIKGMILDRAHHRLLFSMRDKNAVGIVHLDTGAIESWSALALHMNVPLAIDPKHQLLFVGSRKPGKLSVVDASNGHLLQELPSTETSDSMSYDASHDTLYVSGDTGMSRYHVDAAGRVSLLETDPALDGKTSLFVPELRRLYVMRRKSASLPAALTIFDIVPD